MDTNVYLIHQKDGYKTSLYYFYCKEEPKASILILHGMAEHHRRYYPFAKFLNSKGIDVYLYDHRGHGTDKMPIELGFFDRKKGYQKVIHDSIEILQYIKSKNRCNKLFLMGHSMGSLIARNIISKYNDLDGVILCGTTKPPTIQLKSGLLLTKIIKLIYGPKHRSYFMNTMLFGNKYYKRFITRTSYDWLSSNNASVGAYLHDPYCGFICTISFYYDLLKIANLASKMSGFKKIRPDLPIFIISGEKDPVSRYCLEIKHILNIFKKLNFTQVEAKLYPGCRHELLQEINSEEIMKDIYDWLIA